MKAEEVVPEMASEISKFIEKGIIDTFLLKKELKKIITEFEFK